ncbi:biopolymer transporter ExbD [Niabella sp. CC-SYL272]|uniref:ExbD/TolR family protein n=1 Tax=Niabella agricola TaxID=2891571 RepID=UPI001F2FB3B7|nr:biopolymer transporter ExbD [Niabella agricola]MCF3109965.1 biopolymer transporter ExbD [Niabella agricola]
MSSMEMVPVPVDRKRHRGLSFSRSAIKIDMTPMVDLGFLLITFFIYTTAMGDPSTMSLSMPKDGPQAPTASSGVFTILVGDHGRLTYYEGPLQPKGLNLHEITPGALRTELMRKKAEVMAQYVPDPVCEAKAQAENRSPETCRQNKLMVIIKPGKNADYKTVVRVLDEMLINQVARYALTAPDAEELKHIP